MRQNNNVWLRIDQCSGAYHVLLFSWIIDCWKRICVCLRERERALAWSGYGAFIWAQGRWKGWVHRQDVPLVIPVSALVWSVADFGLVFRLTVVHIGLFSALMSGRRTSCGIEHLQPRPRSEPSPSPLSTITAHRSIIVIIWWCCVSTKCVPWVAVGLTVCFRSFSHSDGIFFSLSSVFCYCVKYTKVKKTFTNCCGCTSSRLLWYQDVLCSPLCS